MQCIEFFSPKRKFHSDKKPKEAKTRKCKIKNKKEHHEQHFRVQNYVNKNERIKPQKGQ